MKTTLTIVIVGLLAASGCRKETLAEPAEVRGVPGEIRVTPKQIEESGITTAAVGVRPIGSQLTLTGRVTFSDARVAHVFSPVTGRVTRLLADLGQTVQRGTPLAILQSPDVGSAIADVQKADADLAAAERDYQRQKELYEAHAAAQRDFEAAESSYRKAKAERERATQKSSLLFASTSPHGAQEYVLRAPIGGEVAARNVSPGTEIQGQYSGGNAPELFTIGNLETVWVLADVFEVDIPRIHTGAPVTISVVSYPDHQFSGRVDWISGSLDASTRTARIRCTIDNQRRLLRPEMFATVSIITDAHEKLAVPRAAIVRLGNEMVAFVDKGPLPGGGERFERRRVAVGETDAGDYVPVLSGLTAGERVVTSGSVILSGGSNG